jgi:tRNA threonylcarbamoyladenosine biosynthesis protein TsaE
MPILDPHSVEFISRGAEYTRRVGMRLGSLLKTNDVVCLVGDLGTGKTTFVQGLAAGWGSLDRVSSPTFVLVNLYRRLDGNHFYHLDAYRINDTREAEELDVDLMVESGVLVVEWADRINLALPEEHLRVALRWIDFNQRDLIFSPVGKRYQLLLSNLRKRVYGGL